MSALFALSALALGASSVSAQTSSALEPLASKHFTWPNIPYQVTGDQGGERGPQAGYNLCNSTTENQKSMCQTLFLNNAADFCMWSSGDNTDKDTIGESEAREVAWCTQPGHGTRIIPPGSITGMQWLYAKNYLQVVGYINQTAVGIDPTDQGGELDPHGADEQGNPLGGIVFTNGFGQSSSSFQDLAKGGNFTANQTYTQVIEWIDFLGGGIFCLKMCNPADPNAALQCQHIYDEVGCTYNAIADYQHINGTFSVCDTDDMADPGIFTTNGQVSTWHQPFSGTFSIPYQTSIPASSNCVTYSSEQLFAAAATDTAAGFTVTSTDSSGHAVTKTGSSSGSSKTGSSSGSSSGAAPVFHGSDALPFFGVAMVTMVATMFAMLA